MKIQTVQYHKVFNLGNFSNEKIGVEITLAEGENPIDAFGEAKKIVEKSHNFFADLPKYEAAKLKLQNPMEYTGWDLKQAETLVELFQANYPDYLDKFMPPSSRTLTEGEMIDF